jgi:hypothetical protein
MNDALKNQWVEALTNGSYLQARGMLRSLDNKYCCLGVLCDLYQKQNPETSRWEFTEQTDGRYVSQWVFIHDHFTATHPSLDTGLDNWLRNLVGLHIYEEGQLVMSNDCGTPFSKIAEIIKSFDRQPDETRD